MTSDSMSFHGTPFTQLVPHTLDMVFIIYEYHGTTMVYALAISLGQKMSRNTCMQNKILIANDVNENTPMGLAFICFG
jgi:hypothetical protein